MNQDRVPGERAALAERFAELLELPAPERESHLREIERDDPELAARLEGMLAADEIATGPIERARDEVAIAARARFFSDEAPGPPEELGSWRLGRLLGAGGMGEVYLGSRSRDGFEQRAAIKIVRQGMASHQVVERFLLERRILARLDHPAIARLLDGGRSPDGRPWFAMELVEGEWITRWVERERLDLRRVLELFVEVVDAVDVAHRSLVLHRDLKPSNILITADGRPRLLDFGLAKVFEERRGEEEAALTVSEVAGFTPAYASPEQVFGEPVTTATDVYSLGVLLFELLTGELPHRRSSESVGALVAELSRETLERPSVRLRRKASGDREARRRARRLEGDLDTIVLRTLARDPGRRYPSAAALAEDLRRHLQGRTVLARPDSWRYRVGKLIRRNRATTAAAALAVLSLVGGLTAALVQAERATAAAERSRHESERALRMKDFLLSIFREASPLQRERGQPLSIEELLDAAERRIDVELVDEPLLQADLWDDLAETRASAGELERASGLLEKALATKRTHLPENDTSLVESLVNRGAIANLAKRAEDALLALDEAAAILAARGEPDSEPATNLSINRVHALLLLGRHEEAATEAERAHGLAERWRPGTPDAAMQSHNAGMIAVRRGRYEEAREAFSSALAELEPVVGPDHALVRLPLAGLAGVLENDLGDPAAAVPFWERYAALTRLHFPQDSQAREQAEASLERARGKLAP